MGDNNDVGIGFKIVWNSTRGVGGGSTEDRSEQPAKEQYA